MSISLINGSRPAPPSVGETTGGLPGKPLHMQSVLGLSSVPNGLPFASLLSLPSEMPWLSWVELGSDILQKVVRLLDLPAAGLIFERTADNGFLNSRLPASGVQPSNSAVFSLNQLHELDATSLFGLRTTSSVNDTDESAEKKYFDNFLIRSADSLSSAGRWLQAAAEQLLAGVGQRTAANENLQFRVPSPTTMQTPSSRADLPPQHGPKPQYGRETRQPYEDISREPKKQRKQTLDSLKQRSFMLRLLQRFRSLVRPRPV
jgi:hypothetical protein